MCCLLLIVIFFFPVFIRRASKVASLFWRFVFFQAFINMLLFLHPPSYPFSCPLLWLSYRFLTFHSNQCFSLYLKKIVWIEKSPSSIFFTLLFIKFYYFFNSIVFFSFHLSIFTYCDLLQVGDQLHVVLVSKILMLVIIFQHSCLLWGAIPAQILFSVYTE